MNPTTNGPVFVIYGAIAVNAIDIGKLPRPLAYS